MITYREHRPRGFTLVETLVAISIITTAIVGPFSAIQYAVTTANASRDRLIAVSLAQEAVETVRSVRDGNFLYVAAGNPDRGWLYAMDGSGSTANCFAAAGCTIDAANYAIAACPSSGSCSPVRLNSSQKLYNQAPVSATNPATRFTRTVKLTSISATEIQVTVTVTWSTNRQPYTVTVTDTLTKWL